MSEILGFVSVCSWKRNVVLTFRLSPVSLSCYMYYTKSGQHTANCSAQYKSTFEPFAYFRYFYLVYLPLQADVSILEAYYYDQFHKKKYCFITLKLLTLFYTGGGSKRPPPADYRTLILGECPEWADFS